MVCPFALRSYRLLEESTYIQVLADREILPYVIFGGFEEGHLLRLLTTALEEGVWLSGTLVSELVKDMMKDSKGGRRCFQMMVRDL